MGLAGPCELVIKQKFSASRFVAEGKAERVHHLFGVGAMGTAILATPEQAHDADPGTIRSSSWVPMTEDDQLQFERRFKITTWGTGYGQTECMPIAHALPTGPRNRRASGLPVPNLDVAIVDDDDREVERGKVGEIVVRPRHPHMMYQGYWRKPEATLATLRNLWHHTGDYGRQDADGHLYFVDRKQQSIRRRGENVSSHELEAAIRKHPAIFNVAVHAVASPLGEDDIKAVLVLHEGRSAEPAELFEFFAANLPYFAVPRYLEIRATLPVNAAGRVMKHILKAEGITDSTCDLEAMGLTVAHEKSGLAFVPHTRTKPESSSGRLVSWNVCRRAFDVVDGKRHTIDQLVDSGSHGNDNEVFRMLNASSPETDDGGSNLVGRRRFLGFLLAAPTLVAAAELVGPAPAVAAVPSPPQPADLFDIGDAVTLAQAPTAHLITVQVHEDGTASMALPRVEVGQGITTTVAMLIAEELYLPLSKVDVSLADSRPELLFGQITGGSTGVRTLYQPVRVAAAVARERLMATAAARWQVPLSSVTVRYGMVSCADGRTATYGSLAADAASATLMSVSAPLKPESEFTVIGTAQSRVDGHDIVTGRKQFTMDVSVAGAKPAMVRRPPTINGTVRSVANLSAVRAMPGITDVVVISTGVAVRGDTFGQCVDAVRALNVTWNGGTADGESDDTVVAKLKNATLPSTPAAPLTGVVDQEFVFSFVSNSALETNCAIADVRADGAELWASLKTPILWQQEIAKRLGLPQDAVTVHVTQGGGSFGRKLFGDAALEAVEVSQKLGKPVKLMWHRTDDFRHGRMHPMSFSRVRATYALGNVLTFEQRHTEVETDFRHGFGEMMTATLAQLPEGNVGLSAGMFELMVATPYNFGVVTQTLTDVAVQVPTGSMRDVWAPNVKCAQELVADRLAAKLGKDPYAFRREFLKNDRQRAVLDTVARLGGWGRSMPAGTAQGIAFHEEYRSCSAVLVDIDCRPETTGRPVRDGVTGPRVTKAVAVVDAGRPINPRGLEAQMIGGVTDGIGLALTFSVHLDHGLPLEGSWDNTFYTRQWNMPIDVQVVVLPASTGTPGGFGEVGVAPSMAATACAYARATGTMPTSFPINYGTLGFEPLPREPSIPQSPTDGLDHAF